MSTARDISADDRAEIREIFDHFDKDHNGAIDAEEFTSLLDALGADMAPEEIEVGLSIVDVDGNGTVEWAEFLAWWIDTRTA